MLKAFACSIKGSPFPPTIIYHTTVGKAKYQFFIDLDDCYPDLKYTDITAYKVETNDDDKVHREFARTATYRGVPFAKIGMAVRVEGHEGEIAGKNSDANFDVLFLEGPHKGLILNCHPNWAMEYFDEQGNLIKAFDAA